MRHVDFTDSSLMQDNFLVASTTESDQPANRFCYALDAWERLIWPREFIFRCVKSQKAGLFLVVRPEL